MRAIIAPECILFESFAGLIQALEVGFIWLREEHVTVVIGSILSEHKMLETRDCHFFSSLFSFSYLHKYANAAADFRLRKNNGSGNLEQDGQRRILDIDWVGLNFCAHAC